MSGPLPHSFDTDDSSGRVFGGMGLSSDSTPQKQTSKSGEEKDEVFVARRHMNLRTEQGDYRSVTREPSSALHPWRQQNRMRTVTIAMVMCLNVNFHPPDGARPTNCKNMQAWVDIPSAAPGKVLEMIGSNLQAQYSDWQPRARFKLSMDPTLSDVKKLTMSLRKNARRERVMLHYNGHGMFML